VKYFVKGRVYDHILVTIINLENPAAIITVIIPVILFQNHISFTRI